MFQYQEIQQFHRRDVRGRASARYGGLHGLNASLVAEIASPPDIPHWRWGCPAPSQHVDLESYYTAGYYVLCEPPNTQNEPLEPRINIENFAHYVELTAYPQRSALEPLLTEPKD